MASVSSRLRVSERTVAVVASSPAPNRTVEPSICSRSLSSSTVERSVDSLRRPAVRAARPSWYSPSSRWPASIAQADGGGRRLGVAGAEHADPVGELGAPDAGQGQRGVVAGRGHDAAVEVVGRGPQVEVGVRGGPVVRQRALDALPGVLGRAQRELALRHDAHHDRRLVLEVLPVDPHHLVGGDVLVAGDIVADVVGPAGHRLVARELAHLAGHALEPVDHARDDARLDPLDVVLGDPAGLELDQRLAGDALEVGEGLARRRIGRAMMAKVQDSSRQPWLAWPGRRGGCSPCSGRAATSRRRRARTSARRGAPRRGGSGTRWGRRSASGAARRCPRARCSGRRRG